MLAIAAHRLGGAIQQMWPQAAAADVSLLAEELVRLALSHAMLPQGDPAEAARRVAMLLTPSPNRRWQATEAGRPGRRAAGRRKSGAGARAHLVPGSPHAAGQPALLL